MAQAKKKLSMNERNRQKRSAEEMVAEFSKKWWAKQDELIQKHNELAKSISEIGQKQNALSVMVGRSFQQIYSELGGGMERQDLNIVAMSELLKELVGQIMVTEAHIEVLKGDIGVNNAHVHDLTSDQRDAAVTASEGKFKELMAVAFTRARAKIEKERAEAVEQVRQQEAQQADAQEKNRAETELRAAADSDRGIQQISSMGGPGAEIPEGADVFGG